MVDSACVRRLSMEAADCLGAEGELRAQDLESALPPHLHMLGQIDASHSPLANEREDVISVGDGLADEGIGRGAHSCVMAEKGRWERSMKRQSPGSAGHSRVRSSHPCILPTIRETLLSKLACHQ